MSEQKKDGEDICYLCEEDCEHCEWVTCPKMEEDEEEVGKDVLTAMKESAEAVKNSPHYDFSCVTSLFREEADE